MTEKKFNYGLGVLRLLAMYMVIVVHISGQGGALANTTGIGLHIGNIIRIFCYCCVDLYALLSGYVGYRENNENYKYSKYITIWVQVVTYGFGIALIYYILRGNVTTAELLKSLLPVTTGQYWYFSAYTGVFFLVPWFNRFVARLSEKETNQMLVVVLAVFSGYVAAGQLIGDGFLLMSGYSFVWIAILYVVGAGLKKNNIPEKLSNKVWFIIMIALVVFSWVWKTYVPTGYGKFLFYSYTSPTVVGTAICLLAIFSKINVNPGLNNIIKILGNATFGVYIFHLQWLIWDNYISGKFTWVSDLAGLLVPVVMLLASLMVYVVCLIIELIRIYLFKVLKITWLINKLQTMVDKIINKVLSVV